METASTASAIVKRIRKPWPENLPGHTRVPEQIRRISITGLPRRIRHELDLEDARPQLTGERQMPGGRKVRDSIQNVRGSRLPGASRPEASIHPSLRGVRINACDVVVLPDVGVDDASTHSNSLRLRTARPLDGPRSRRPWRSSQHRATRAYHCVAHDEMAAVETETPPLA